MESLNQNHYFEIKGTNPYTKKVDYFKDYSRWMSTYSDSINKGDTIFKEKGDDFYLIKKKDRILKIYTFKCDSNGMRDRTSFEIEVITNLTI